MTILGFWVSSGSVLGELYAEHPYGQRPRWDLAASEPPPWNRFRPAEPRRVARRYPRPNVAPVLDHVGSVKILEPPCEKSALA